MELLQGSGDAPIGGKENEVVVVAHERVGDQRELAALENDGEATEEADAVVVVHEEVAPVARVRGEVVEAVHE